MNISYNNTIPYIEFNLISAYTEFVLNTTITKTCHVILSVVCTNRYRSAGLVSHGSAHARERMPGSACPGAHARERMRMFIVKLQQ